MALIKTMEKDEATGLVADIYENMVNTLGFIPNAFKLFSTSPHLLEASIHNLGYFMRHKTLGGKLLAFIRLLVSEQETCEYCVSTNAGILLQYGVLPEHLTGIKADPSTAPLEPREVAMLLFVLKLVRDARSITPEEVQTLRDQGWSDAEILEASFHGTSQVGSDKLFNAFRIESDF